MKLFTPTVDAAHHADHHKTWGFKADLAPIYMVMGMVLVALSIGAHTAKQQLVYSPAVHVSKKKRESLQEVEDPDRVVDSADKFINKSFLRKVAHIQDNPNNNHVDPFTVPRHADTLKSVGIDPSHH